MILPFATDRRRRQRLTYSPPGARALGVGLLSGGYVREELLYAGALRVYEDPRGVLAHLDEVACAGRCSSYSPGITAPW